MGRIGFRVGVSASYSYFHLSLDMHLSYACTVMVRSIASLVLIAIINS